MRRYTYRSSSGVGLSSSRTRQAPPPRALRGLIAMNRPLARTQESYVISSVYSWSRIGVYVCVMGTLM